MAPTWMPDFVSKPLNNQYFMTALPLLNLQVDNTTVVFAYQPVKSLGWFDAANVDSIFVVKANKYLHISLLMAQILLGKSVN